jgi:hypothetical protein
MDIDAWVSSPVLGFVIEIYVLIGTMLQKKHRLVLEKLLTRLNSEEIIWALTGSASFVLCGIDFVVNDIDPLPYGYIEYKPIFGAFPY